MKKIICCVLCCLIINVSFGMAMSTEAVTVTSDRDTGWITVTGNSGVTGEIYVQAYVTNPDVTADMLTAEQFDSRVLTLGASQTTVDGNFTIRMKLPRVNQTGDYKAHIATTTDSIISVDFYYNSPYDVIDALAAFNRYTVGEEGLFQAKLEEISSLFELDTELYNASGFQKDKVAAAMIADRPANGYTDIAAFRQMFDAQVHTRILDGETNAFSYLETNKAKLPVDARCFGLTASAKAVLNSKITAANLDRFSQLTALLAAEMLPAGFTTATVWNDYSTLCADFTDILVLSQDYHNKLQVVNAADVYKKMFVNRALLTSNNAILLEYQKQIDATYQAGGSVVPGVTVPIVGGGGGGGGGFVSAGEKAFVSEELKEPLQPVFSDVSEVSWALEAISSLYDKKIISGYPDGTFRPNNLISREEFVKILVSAFSFNGHGASAGFSDVPAGCWYEDAVNIAYANGIINGVDEANFGTGYSITRQDFITMAYRSAEKLGVSLQQRTIPQDYDLISDYAKEPVVKLMGAGIINGKGDGYFDPLGYATRAETAKIIYLLLNYR